jgi:hypothetical protein
MENETVTVTLTTDEVKLITECLLNCPMQTDVKSMPQIIGMVQGIVKKMTSPPPTGTSGEGGQQRIWEGANLEPPV